LGRMGESVRHHESLWLWIPALRSLPTAQGRCRELAWPGRRVILYAGTVQAMCRCNPPRISRRQAWMDRCSSGSGLRAPAENAGPQPGGEQRFGWDHRGNVAVWNDAPLPRRQKHTERSKGLRPKQNASHLLQSSIPRSQVVCGPHRPNLSLLHERSIRRDRGRNSGKEQT